MTTDAKSTNPKDLLLLAGSIRSIFNSEKELPYTKETFTAKCVVISIGAKIETPRVLLHLKNDNEIMNNDLAIHHHKKINGIEKIDVFTNGGCLLEIDPEHQTIHAHSSSINYGQVCREEIQPILQSIFPDYAITWKPGSYKAPELTMKKSGTLYK